VKDPKIKEALNLLAGKIICKNCDNLFFNYGSWKCREYRKSSVKKPSIHIYRHCSIFKSLTDYNKNSNISRMETSIRECENRKEKILNIMSKYK